MQRSRQAAVRRLTVKVCEKCGLGPAGDDNSSSQVTLCGRFEDCRQIDFQHPPCFNAAVRQPQNGLDFYAFAGSMLDAVVLADSTGLITYVNRVAEAIFGYAEADLVGQPISRLMPQRFVDAHNRGMERSRAGESPRFTGQILSLQGLRKDGTEFPIELSLTSWQTAEGKVHSGIIRDLTEQKKSAQRAETQQAITVLILRSRGLWWRQWRG